MRHRERAAELAVFHLHAARGGGAEGAARRRVGMDRVRIPVPLPAVGVAERRGTGVREARFVVELPGREDLRLLVEHVGARRAHEPEVVTLGLHRLPSQRRTAGEAKHHLVVATQIGRLQGVGSEIRDGRLRVGAVHRLDRHERRDVGERIRDAGTVVVVVGESLVGLVPAERRINAQAPAARKRLVEVDTEALALVERVVDDSAIALGAARDEIARVLGPPAQVQGGFVRQRLVPGNLLQVVEERQLAVHDVRPHPSVAVLREGRGGVEHARARAPLQLEEPQPLRDVGARLPRPPVICLDDDHAVPGLGTIDGRRGGPAQHLDRLDIVRVQVGEPVHRVVLLLAVAAVGAAARDVEQPTGHGSVAVNHPVDHEERVGIAEDRVVAAQLDLRAAARRARVLADDGARHPPGKSTVERGRGYAGHFFPDDVRRRDRSVAPLDARGLPGDDDRLEVEDVGLERRVGRVLIGRDPDLAPLERDAPEHQRHGTGGCGNRIPAFGVRHRAERGAGDGHVDAGDRLVGRRRRDAAGDLALLRRYGGRTDERRQGQRE